MGRWNVRRASAGAASSPSFADRLGAPSRASAPRCRTFRTRASLAAAVLGACSATTARAAIFEWNSAADGKWHEPRNWEQGRVPGEQDLALFDRGSSTAPPYTVDFTETAVVNDLQVQRGRVVFNLADHEFNLLDNLRVGTLPQNTAELRLLNGTMNIGGVSAHYIGGAPAGAAAGGGGTLILDNAAVDFYNADNSRDKLVVGGYGGTGLLSVVNSSNLSLHRIVMGEGGNSAGAMVVQNSKVTTTGVFVMGDGVNEPVRTNLLNITNGGSLETGDAYVGGNTRNYGAVNISSTEPRNAALWQVNGNLFLGGVEVAGVPPRVSQGQVTLGAGGRLNVAGNLKILDNNDSKLVLDGGYLSVGSYDLANSDKRLAWNTGTLEITKGVAFVGPGSPLGRSLTLGAGQTLKVLRDPPNPNNGLFSVNSEGAFNLAGGTVQAFNVDLVNANAFDFSGGNLIVDGGRLFTGSQFVMDVSGPTSTNRPRLQLVNGATHINGKATLLLGSADEFGGIIVSGGSRAVFDSVQLDSPSRTTPSILTVTGANSSLQTLSSMNIGNGGRLDILAGGSMLIQENLFNDGQIFLAAGSELQIEGSFAMGPGGSFTGGGTMYMTSGSVGGDGFCSTDLTVVIDGFFSVAPGADMCVDTLVFEGTSGPNLAMQSDDAVTNLSSLKFDNEIVSTATEAGAEITRDLAATIDMMSLLTPQVRSITVSEASTLTSTVDVDLLIESKITNGELRKAGAGTLRLTNSANDFSKSYIANGTLESTAPGTLGTGEVVFENGTLSLKSDTADLTWANHLNATASGARIRVGRDTAAGAAAGTFTLPSLAIATQNLEVSGANRNLRFSGPVTLSGNPTVKTSVPLEFAGAITKNNLTARNLTISEPGDAPASTVTFSGGLANDYNGLTRVNAGTLLLNKTAGVNAIPGRLEVFGGSTTRLLAANQIANAADVQVSGVGSRLELNGHAETVNSLSVEAQGALFGGGNLTTTGAITTATNGQVTARTATLSLTGGSITNNAVFDARSNGTLDVVTTPTNFNAVTGTLTGGTWQVTGPATMRLRGANVTTLAATVVLDGVGSNLYSSAAGTTDALANLSTIAAGGTLIVRNGRNFTAPAGLTFTTSGTLNIGASSTFTAGGLVHKPAEGTITRNATSKLDLKTHGLLFQSTLASREADLATLTAAIAAARNTNPALWQGNGITTSSATDLTGLGIVLNDDGTGQPLHAGFNGVPANTSAILIKFTHYGDANVDGVVDINDFFRIDRGRAMNLGGWAYGDFNYSGGEANGDDLMLADRGFLSQGVALSLAPAPMALSAGASSVPEPCSLIGLLGAGLLLRRRRSVL